MGTGHKCKTMNPAVAFDAALELVCLGRFRFGSALRTLRPGIA
jgi:hypothetical protein